MQKRPKFRSRPSTTQRAALNDREGGGGERGRTPAALATQELRRRAARVRRARVRRQSQAPRGGTPPRRVAIVGYANTGKSTLLRALAGDASSVADCPFATSETAARRPLAPAAAPPIEIVDTAGFRRALPHGPLALPHATLAEARDAGLALLIVDASDPDWRAQLDGSRAALAPIDAAGVPVLTIVNKIDRIDEATRAAIARERPEAMQLCAREPADVARLREAIERALELWLADERFDVPLSSDSIVGELHREARVIRERRTDSGVELAVRARPETLARIRAALPPRQPVTTAAELLDELRPFGVLLVADGEGGLDFDDTGLDFRALRARDERGEPWIVRVPRRDDLLPRLLVEGRLLRFLEDRLPVAVPSWRVQTRAAIAYRRLLGTPAVTLDTGVPVWNVIDPGAPSAPFLDSFARALAALQAVPSASAARLGVPVRSVAEARAAIGRAMDETRAALAPSEALWRRWQRWLDDDLLWPTHVALVHGDLHPGHMLLGGGGALVGLLDWTEAEVTDPSVDLALFHGCFGGAALADLIPRFAAAGGRTWPGLARHAAERWAASSALGAAWALRTNNAAALEHVRGFVRAAEEETERRGGT